MHVVGVDIAKSKFDLALLMQDKFKTKVFSNDVQGIAACLKWLASHAPQAVHACMEATGSYGHALAEALFDAGHTVSMINPARAQAFANTLGARSKTDGVDARILARLCQAVQPAPWAPEPKPVRALRGLVQRLDALVVMRVQESNRLEGASEAVACSISEHLAFLDQRIEQLRQSITEHIDQHPDLREQRELLCTIPGVGHTTAAWLIGLLQLTRFDSARAAAAYVGLTPAHRQSGSSLHARARLSKRGHPGLRKALYMPALAAMRFNPILKAFAKRLLARGKHKMAIIGAIMRKLVHIAFGVIKSRKPFNAQLAGA
jgi:transposase